MKYSTTQSIMNLSLKIHVWITWSQMRGGQVPKNIKNKINRSNKKIHCTFESWTKI